MDTPNMPEHPDPTPPSHHQYFQKELESIRDDHRVLRQDHETLKSEVRANNMAHIHLLSQVAKSVQAVHREIKSMNSRLASVLKTRKASKKVKAAKHA